MAKGYDLKHLKELDFHDLPDEELLAIAQDCETEVIHIASQIKAKSTPHNTDWQLRATTAKDLLQQYGEHARQIMNQRKRDRQETLDRLFVNEARNILPDHVFESILTAAKQKAGLL